MSLAGGGLTGGEHSGDAAYMHSQAEVENSMAILGKKKSQYTEKKNVRICTVRQRKKTGWPSYAEILRKQKVSIQWKSQFTAQM
jgi:hypothetical protein